MHSSTKASEPGDRTVESTQMTVPKTVEAVRILYVEDDPTSARLVKMIAEKEGYTVSLAGTEQEALRLVAEEAPRLFLLDLTLPDGSRLDLLPRLRVKHPG